MTRARKLTEAQIAEIVRLREERGRSVNYIARQFSVSTSAVNYQLLRNGVDPWDPEKYNAAGRHPGAFSPEEDARMLALGAAGMPAHRIALEMNRPKTSVLIRLLTLEVRAEKKPERAA